MVKILINKTLSKSNKTQKFFNKNPHESQNICQYSIKTSCDILPSKVIKKQKFKMLSNKSSTDIINSSKNNSNKLPEWDLSDLYKSNDDPALESDLNDLKKRTDNFVVKYKNKIKDIIRANDQDQDLTQAAKTLAAAIKEYELINEMLGKIMAFAYLQKAKASTDEQIAIFYQNTSDNLSDIETHLIFFTLEINKLDEELVYKCLDLNENLKKYAPWIRKSFKLKKYNLSDEAEKVLHLKSITSSNMLIRLFDETHAGMKFDFNGEKLSNNEIFFFLSSKDEGERKSAAQSISKSLGENTKNLTMIINMMAKDKMIDDELRGFESSISLRNIMNDVEDSVVLNLINTVKEWYPKTSHRYYRLKAKLLNKTKLNYWDRNAPLPDSSNMSFSWSQSRDIVLKAYKSFSPVLADEVSKFFTNNWIDAAILDGKTSGAFCHPCVPSVHPYMLMNFQGKVQDIMTLAHELGHCVHYMLSNKNGHLSNDIPLTLAETASVFGEQLVFRYLMTIDLDKKERKSMIAKKIEDIISTVMRQIAFCDFELRLHERRKKSELSYDEICDIWMDVQRESLGDAFNLSDEYRPYWSYISHFIHAPFYVYSYAFGECLVNSLYKYYLKNEYNFANKYVELLSCGGTKHHSELLKPFGMDLNDKNFWAQGLSMLDELITELESMD
jgi:oligoendopeptidase F